MYCVLIELYTNSIRGKRFKKNYIEVYGNGKLSMY